MISRALLNAPFFIPKDADLLRNRKVNTKKRQNRHLPELAFLILGTYFTAPFSFLMYILTKGIRFHQSNQIRLVHINVTLLVQNPDNLTLIHAQWNQVPQFLPVQLHGDRSFSLRR